MTAIRTWFGLLVFLGLLLGLEVGLSVQSDGRSPGRASDILVVLRPESHEQRGPAATEDLLNEFAEQGLLQLEPLGIDGPMRGAAAYLGTIDSRADISSLLASLAQSSHVLRAEPNVVRDFDDVEFEGPYDQYFVKQGYYSDTGVVAMWDRGFTGISVTHPITVAVIDTGAGVTNTTGVGIYHPDLEGNLVPGYDFVGKDHVPQDMDCNSHGSMVAGIIAAQINNGYHEDPEHGWIALGVAGIGGGDELEGTPGLRLMPVRVAAASSAGVDCATSAKAIVYATMHGAQVINMSYGGAERCELELDAVRFAYRSGVALVAGAGNGGSQAPIYPAAYGAGANDRLVIAVGGVDADGVKADDSNYGTWIDVCAPFDSIWSTTKIDYWHGSGTSYSAPLVSGLIGVLMSNFGWNRDRAISVLLLAADNVDAIPGNEDYQGLLGAGRINADRATAANTFHWVYLPLVVLHR